MVNKTWALGLNEATQVYSGFDKSRLSFFRQSVGLRKDIGQRNAMEQEKDRIGREEKH